MAKKRTVRHISSKKRSRPKVKFNFGVLIIIFILSFGACFALYMIAANTQDNFLKDEKSKKSVVQKQPDEKTDEAPEAEAPTDAPSSAPIAAVNPIPQSEAVDASYFDSCCLVTDSTLLAMGDYTSLDDIIGSTELNAAGCRNVQVVSDYGTIKVYEIIQFKKPDILYLMLGSDIGTSSIDDMVNSYSTLVDDLHDYLPDMKIYIMQLPPVIYDTETVTNDLINQYNSKLLDIAKKSGVYCIDTNTALKATAEGRLADEYWDYENSKLSEAAYKKISDYIRTHTVS
ncbi:MAG: hypothetical protein IJ010_04120 [Ruminococcus sp.]|nr:hypothetical protein [Ruminococcus sp.]